MTTRRNFLKAAGAAVPATLATPAIESGGMRSSAGRRTRRIDTPTILERHVAFGGSL